MTDFYTVGKTDAATAPIKDDGSRVMVYDHTAWVNGSTPGDYADMLRGFTDGLSARLGYAVTLEIETENHGRDWYWIRRAPLLPDQPPPTPGTGDLWREMIDSNPTWNAPRTIAMCEERRRLGIERYGTPLQRDNGRDFGVDLVQELLDAAVYAQGADRPSLAKHLIGLVADINDERGER